MTAVEYALAAAIGCVAGLVGGVLGLGGAIVIIPALTLLWGPDQHLYQASAMVVNVAVAGGSLVRHWGAGTVRLDVLRRLILPALACVVLGVAVSNRIDSTNLRRLFALFLFYLIAVEATRALRPARSVLAEPVAPQLGWPRLGIIGGVSGALAGLLGIGGGVSTIPMLRGIAHLPIRESIATSSALILLIAPVGAIQKVATIRQATDGSTGPRAALELAALLLVPAIIGSVFGSRLSYRLPAGWLRIVLVAFLLFAGVRMLMAS